MTDEMIGIGEDLGIETVFATRVDIPRNVVRVETFLGSTADRTQPGTKNLGLRFDRTHLERQNAFIEPVENVESPADKLVMPHAGVRKQNETDLLRFQRIENADHRAIEFEDVGRGNDQIVEVDGGADELLKVPMKFFRREESSFEFPLHAGIEQQPPKIVARFLAKRSNLLAHAVVAEMQQHIPHVEQTRANHAANPS